jgi:retron-type reverse transcriptase
MMTRTGIDLGSRRWMPLRKRGNGVGGMIGFLDMDIKGFFDALDHNLVMKAVAKFTGCQWTLLYIERWLKAM